MNDIYVEYSFDVKPALKKKIFRNILIIIGILMIIYSFYFLPLLTMGVFVLVLAYFYNRTLNVEYEYILMQDELVIDKIINKSKRKNLYKINLQYLEAFTYNNKALKQKYSNEKVKVKRCHSGNENEQIYALMTRKSNHSTCVLLNADNKLIEGFKRLYPSKVDL